MRITYIKCIPLHRPAILAQILFLFPDENGKSKHTPINNSINHKSNVTLSTILQLNDMCYYMIGVVTSITKKKLTHFNKTC
jgi:hypothetical protein